jgi:hypothetical protein
MDARDAGRIREGGEMSRQLIKFARIAADALDNAEVSGAVRRPLD